ncbi:MAG: putative ABC exporter domain-containing protein, partial [Candidatus Eremiobacteraeota bacterium]|nr:putative ABC exporter domain-containing protein [Candidatus Eremiobacteraeota bacterium]
MSSLAALLYLEGCIFMNRVRQIVRRPGRLVVWLLFVLWFGSFIFFRATRPPNSFTSSLPYELGLLYAFVPALVLVLLGMQVVIGCRRAPAAFAYPADARFLFGSHLPNRLVVFWLQLREAFFSGTRMFFVLFVSAWAFARSPLGLITAAVALAAMYVTMFGTRLPAFLANRRMPGWHVPWWGAAIVGAGALSLAYSFFHAVQSHDFQLRFLARHMPQLPPGTWLIGALHGQLAPLALLCALAALMVSVGSLASEDAYPELWEASARLYAFRSLAASGRILWNREAWRKLRDADPATPQRTPASALSVSGEGTPGGALTLLWKEWLALRRTPG